MTHVDEAFGGETVEACLQRKAGVFGGFYRPLLADCAHRIARWETEWDADRRERVDLRRIARPLLDAVLDDLHHIGIRALISAFRAQRGDADGLDYAGFHARISTGAGRAALLEGFPELGRLLHLATERHLRHTAEVLQAAADDRPALADTLGAGERVVGLRPGLGDPHRGGRSVCIVHWDNGVDTVYKPQRRSCLSLLQALQHLLDPDGAFFGPLCPPALVRDTRLWQGYVAGGDLCASGEDPDAAAARYFRRFGRCAALLSLLGANDLHHENVIATPEGPVVIDLETLVSLPERTAEGASGVLPRDIELSPLNTLLFPLRNMGGHVDVDLSALGTVRTEQSRRLTSFTVVDPGTDDIRFATEPAAIPPGGANVATAGGEQLDPRVWVDHLTTGYSEARDLLERHRGAVAERAARGDWSVRQILRPTLVYGRFLEASTHPAYLADQADRAALFDKLPPRQRGVAPEAGGPTGRAETEALVDRDVPYFEVEADSRDLCVNGTGRRIPDAVAATPREALLSRIERFLARPVGRDLAYIRYSLASSVDDIWETGVRRGQRRAAVAGALPHLSDTAAWHRMLAESVVEGPDGAACLMPRLYGPGLRLDGTNTLLYEGGGLLVYLAQAAACGQDTGVDVDALFAGAAPEPVPQDPFPLAVSPFTGLLATRITGLELRLRGAAAGTALPVKELPDTSRVAVEALTAEDFDYVNGFGGYLRYLAGYDDPDGPAQAGPAAEPLLRRLVEVDGPPGEHSGEVGLAHGRFGRIAAMSAQVAGGTDTDGRARAHLEHFAEAYLRHRWRDDALRDPASQATWCKGYAGIAAAAADMLACLGTPAAEIRRALEPEAERIVGAELTPDLSLCHGAAGRTAMLCVLADRLDWPELRTEARRLSDAFLERYGEGRWCSGIGAAPELPGFMLGVSGWHFARLMLSGPEVRPPYCLGGRR
ncbi:type 2 lanthipeptide synthetase LanM [Streptomonospora sp. PA3]|uniref:type 2 lanthipeptide synthetase LanM n=1 Tax=Streptomonospora sp. PA3 TaxID=2607326 RepID=UPI0012DD4593